jgi:hypothetical protein
MTVTDNQHAPIRLTGREWLAVAAIMLVVIVSAPLVWKQIEPFKPGLDYRIPYKLSSDYWLYDRLCEQAVAQDKIGIIGDSVIWGHYVAPDQTLSHCLNAALGRDRFVNLGLDGAHPAALCGLLAYYARAITGRTVVLHFNPLWISSEKHDLSTTKEFSFNHPKLVPQFTPRIPCYRASTSRRIEAVAERYVPFLSWTSHLRIACFDDLDPSAWTVEHPYENPLKSIADWDPGDNLKSQISNPKSDIRPSQSTNVQWVSLDDSLQWRFFRQSVEVLQARKNTVFVLVGPLNEHALNAEDVAAYERIKQTIDTWLTDRSIAHWIAPALPTSLYADLSHPTAEGYALLAKQLLDQMDRHASR